MARIRLHLLKFKYMYWGRVIDYADSHEIPIPAKIWKAFRAFNHHQKKIGHCRKTIRRFHYSLHNALYKMGLG